MSTVYDIVTEKIIKQLSKGTVPWKKPWSSNCPSINGEPVVDQNLFTRKPYRGINALLTMLAPFDSPFWITKKVADQNGLSIKEDEKGNYTPIVYFNWQSKDRLQQAKLEGKSLPPCFIKFYKVWNVEQVIGAEELLPVFDTIAVKDHTPIEKAVQIVENYEKCPRINGGSNIACYRPSTDIIEMPHLEFFNTVEQYHGTLFHELVHATGHKSRLDRKTLVDYTPFGSDTYSKEELVAEIGSCFLCNLIGIDTPETFQNSSAYINGWASKLRQDSRLVVDAAQAAQKAVDHILQKKFDNNY